MPALDRMTIKVPVALHAALVARKHQMLEDYYCGINRDLPGGAAELSIADVIQALLDRDESHRRRAAEQRQEGQGAHWCPRCPGGRTDGPRIASDRRGRQQHQ